MFFWLRNESSNRRNRATKWWSILDRWKEAHCSSHALILRVEVFSLFAKCSFFVPGIKGWGVIGIWNPTRSSSRWFGRSWCGLILLSKSNVCNRKVIYYYLLLCLVLLLLLLLQPWFVSSITITIILKPCNNLLLLHITITPCLVLLDMYATW